MTRYRTVKAAPRPDARRAALIGVPLGLAAGVTALALGTHFADTRNWTGAGAVLGGFVLLMLAPDLTAPGGQRLRRAAGTLKAVAVSLPAADGMYWILGHHWAEAVTCAALAAWCTAIGAVMLAVSRVRRRLYWNKYGYSPEARRAQADAGRLFPRRGQR